MAEEINWGAAMHREEDNAKKLKGLEDDIDSLKHEKTTLEKEIKALEEAIAQSKDAKTITDPNDKKNISIEEAKDRLDGKKAALEDKEKDLQDKQDSIKKLHETIKKQIDDLKTKSPELRRYIEEKRLNHAKENVTKYTELTDWAEKFSKSLNFKGSGIDSVGKKTPEKELSDAFFDLLDKNGKLNDSDYTTILDKAQKIEDLKGIDLESLKRLIELSRDSISFDGGRPSVTKTIDNARQKAEKFQKGWQEKQTEIESKYAQLVSADKANDFYTHKAILEYFEKDSNALATQPKGIIEKIKLFFKSNQLIKAFHNDKDRYLAYCEAKKAKQLGDPLNESQINALKDEKFVEELAKKPQIQEIVKKYLDANKADRAKEEQFLEDLKVPGRQEFVDRMVTSSKDQDKAAVEKTEEER